MQPFVQGLPPKLGSDIYRGLLRYLVEKCGDDLEQILGELDAIINLKSSKEVYGFYGGSQNNIAKLASSLRFAIEYQIIQEYSDVPQQKLLELYGPLFESLFTAIDQAAHCLPIFTTNYDRSIEDFCDANSRTYELVDGFSNAGRNFIWSPETFRKFAIREGKRNIVLFKLHGSVDWVFVRARKEIVRTQPFHESIDANRYRNILIYPAVHKVATDEPYFTAYDYYGRCCEHSRLLLTIGYSFRDYDALARLRSAMSFNSNLHMALIAPDAKKILNGLPFEAQQSTPIERLFGDADTLLHLDTVLTSSGAKSYFPQSITSRGTSMVPEAKTTQ